MCHFRPIVYNGPKRIKWATGLQKNSRPRGAAVFFGSGEIRIKIETAGGSFIAQCAHLGDTFIFRRAQRPTSRIRRLRKMQANLSVSAIIALRF